MSVYECELNIYVYIVYDYYNQYLVYIVRNRPIKKSVVATRDIRYRVQDHLSYKPTTCQVGRQ